MAPTTHTEKFVSGQALAVHRDNEEASKLRSQLDQAKRVADAQEAQQKRREQADAATKKRFSVFG